MLWLLEGICDLVIEVILRRYVGSKFKLFWNEFNEGFIFCEKVFVICSVDEVDFCFGYEYILSLVLEFLVLSMIL